MLLFIMKIGNFIKKYTEWEYWPSYMFYVPNLPYAFFLALKLRNFSFYSAVNPSIKNSGNGTESKYNTLALIPDNYKPKSILITTERDIETVLKRLHQKGIDYPIIAKPDMGFRGMLVKKIYSDTALKTYLKHFTIPIILQEFIDLPNECGIFYQRLPHQEKGRISSITLKSFLTVKGNGFSTLADLVKYDKRAQHYIKTLQKSHAAQWLSVPKKDEIISLSAIGNHAKGTQFIDGNHLIDKKLTQTFDNFNKQIKGWYYGRLDIKYTTFEALRDGHFIVLEINGTIAEPTHMYDPYHTTYFKTLKTIRQHWKVLGEIARINLKNGVSSVRFIPFWRDVNDLRKYLNKVAKLTKTSR